MKSTFNRDYTDSLISELSRLSTENCYLYNIFKDVREGNGFLAFRPNSKVSFYMQGRNICDIDSSKNYEPQVDAKYLPLARSDSEINNCITEEEWKSSIGTDKYSWGEIYLEISENLTMLSKNEATQVSGLYKFSPLVESQSKIILLDIESEFSYPTKNGITKPNLRIDAVLYNLETRQLIFLEVKRLSNPELQRNADLSEAVLNQLEKYKELINNEREEIIREYNKTIKAYMELESIEMEPIDENADILMGLLITEFKEHHKKIVCKLSKQIEKEINVPVISIGSICRTTGSTLEKWYSKLVKGCGKELNI